MKNILTLIALLFAFADKAQMQPADSLTGTYAGKYYFKQPTTNPWTITADTVYVTNVDSVNCAVQAHDASHFSIIPPPPPDTNYYTNYYSCNGTAPSNYIKFYSTDSMKLINDNVPQPMPNPAYSMRFYGKRISHYTTGIKQVAGSPAIGEEQISIYPNPNNGTVTIKSKFLLSGETQIQITDAIGKEIRNEKLKTKDEKVVINIGDLQKGIYLLHIKIEQETITKKIIIN